jgi:hypothetical protein
MHCDDRLRFAFILKLQRLARPVSLFVLREVRYAK